MKQGVPRWTTTDEDRGGYLALLDSRSCAVLVHSQAGAFRFKVMKRARPG